MLFLGELLSDEPPTIGRYNSKVGSVRVRAGRSVERGTISQGESSQLDICASLVASAFVHDDSIKILTSICPNCTCRTTYVL